MPPPSPPPALLPLTVELVRLIAKPNPSTAPPVPVPETPPVRIRPSSVRSAVALMIWTLSPSVAAVCEAEMSVTSPTGVVSSPATSPVTRMRPSPSIVTASVIDSVPPTAPLGPSPPSSRIVPLRFSAKVIVSAPVNSLAMAIASRSEKKASSASTTSSSVVTVSVSSNAPRSAGLPFALEMPGKSSRASPRASVAGAEAFEASSAGFD